MKGGGCSPSPRAFNICEQGFQKPAAHESPKKLIWESFHAIFLHIRPHGLVNNEVSEPSDSFAELKAERERISAEIHELHGAIARLSEAETAEKEAQAAIAVRGVESRITEASKHLRQFRTAARSSSRNILAPMQYLRPHKLRSQQQGYLSPAC